MTIYIIVTLYLIGVWLHALALDCDGLTEIIIGAAISAVWPITLFLAFVWRKE